MKILWLQNRARTSHLQTKCPWCESELGSKKEISVKMRWANLMEVLRRERPWKGYA